MNLSIFMVKIMWHCIHWYPGGNFSLSSKVLKAMQTFCISFCIASRQRVVFVSLSISKARLTVFGISNPNLWVVLWYQRLTATRICSFFFVTYGTHQEKAGSPSIPLSIAYWATSIGYDSFRSASHSQVDVPSFHRTHSFQPIVVFLWCCLPLRVIYRSTLRTALESFWWSIIASSSKYWFLSGSHWAYICSVIAFAENSAVWPSVNSTSYNLVSRIGIWLLVPTRLPSRSLAHRVTLPDLWSPLIGSMTLAPT